MKHTLATALLAGVLAAHAQAPPETPPPTPAPAESAPAPSPGTQLPEPERAASPAAATPSAAPPSAPAAKAASPKAPTQRPPTLAPAQSERDTEVASLRQEVARLQSQLDAERAAAVPPAEDGGLAASPVRSVWGWLAVVALFALAGGFVLGWRLLDRRIRRKYGGLRIY